MQFYSAVYFICGALFLYDGVSGGFMPMLIIGAVILLTPITAVVEAIANYRTEKKAASTPDYRKINEMEVELGLVQTDYSEYGVMPIDTAQKTIEENNQFLDELLAFSKPKHRERIIRRYPKADLYRKRLNPLDKPYPPAKWDDYYNPR